MLNRQSGISPFMIIGVIILSACLDQQVQNIPQPSPTPSALPYTSTPRIATFIPSPTNTSIEITSVPFTFETPTPLPTPPNESTTYQLKAWDEESAIGLIDIAEQYTFADNIPMPFGEKRFNYQANQSVIKLAAQEALYRFLDTQHKEKLEWHIALADTILNNPDSDEWILKQIENALNNKRFTPDKLDGFLNPNGFEIGYQQPAFNLFGDGQKAQIIWVIRQDRGYTGLYAALSQDQHGRYILKKIHSSWDFNFGYDEPIKIEEHTGNNIPEVLLFPGYHNGSFCGYQFLIYHWVEDKFVDASQGQFSFD